MKVEGGGKKRARRKGELKGSEREGSETVMMDRVSRRGTPVVSDFSVFMV